MSDPRTELTRARIQLLLNWPLFGQIILHLEPQEVSWCPTAATDGRFFFYNPDFISGLSKEQLIFLSGHEVLHAVLEHVFRRGNRDKALFNMCADYLVNFSLIQKQVGEPLHGILYNPAYNDDYTVEELYALLEQQGAKIQMPIDMHLDGDGQTGSGREAEKDGGDGGDGEALDGPPVYTEAEQQAIRDNLRAALIQGVEQQEQKQAGSTPAGLLRMVNQLLRPKIDWRQMLAHVVRSTIKYDYSYMRLSRRSWSNGLVLPGHDVQDRIEAVCCLDGSGSTTREMITDFLSECRGVMTSSRDFKLIVMTFDTEVYNVVEFTPDNADEINHYEFRGGGGTQPSCCWRYLHEHGIEPHLLLLFSDGEFDDFGEQGFCDTLFVIHSNPRFEAPYGQTIHYEPRTPSPNH